VGLTELHLRGSLAGCERTANGVARAAAARKPPRRSLWGHDRGGRLPHARPRQRGHGARHHVAGHGPLRRHRDARDRGAVLVRDIRTGRRTLVRAGQTHVAPHH
jgi:hypothetical protein